MRFRRYIFYLLFSLAYIGFLMLEKPYFSVHGSWLSYLPTFVVHFSLMVFVIMVNNNLLVPHLLEKKRIVWYILSLVALVAVFTFVRSWYHSYIYERLFHEKSGGISADFPDSLVYGDWFISFASLLLL